MLSTIGLFSDRSDDKEKVLTWLSTNATLSIVIPVLLIGMFLFDLFF